MTADEQKLGWNFFLGGYITLVHAGALIGVRYLAIVSWKTALWAFALWPITGLGVTAGSHRLWAHRSYQATFPVRLALMLCHSISNQGTIFHWAHHHRVHHKHSETDADPHNASRGFLFAHCGWCFSQRHPAVDTAAAAVPCDDLLADPLVMFQLHARPWGFDPFMCFAFPALVARYGWGENVWAAFWVAGALRYVWVLHCTWLVNSAAHFWGARPYGAIAPAENALVALAAMGEGWHNWHHTYPYDYAASEFGITSQFNPTKLFIDTCAAFGLVSKRKRATGAWQSRKLRLKQPNSSPTAAAQKAQ